jgi:hypothetical protein
MTSSYRDPNVTAALAYQAEQEQKRKAQEQPSFIDVAGRTALGLGVAALAGAGIARGLRRNAVRPISVEDLGAAEKGVRTSARYTTRATATPPPSRPAPPAGVARQQEAEEFTRQARAERPAGINQISIQDVVPTEEEFVAYRPDPKEMVSSKVAEARRKAATLALLKASQSRREPYQLTLGGEFSPTLQSIRSSEFGPNLTQVRERALGLVPAEAPSRPLTIAPDQLNIFSPRSYIEQTGSVEPTLKTAPASLVEKQKARTGFTVDQAANALDAAEDQQTGRMKIQLQRNEDLDMGQVEVLEDIASQQRNFMMEQDEPINSVASQLPDGLPVDQAESTGRLGSYTLGRASDADLSQSSAANFLQQRRLKLLEDAEAGTPARLEKKLADAFGPEAWREDPKATRRRNALKLGAAGNEQFFENINEGTFTVGGEQFPVSLLKEGVFMEDTAQNLAERTNKYRDWLGNIRLQETNKQIRLGAELENLNAQDAGLMNTIQQLDAALEQRPASFGTPQQRDRYTQLKRDMQGALERQDELDIQMNQALREFELSERRLAGAQAATSRNIQKSAVPQKLASGIEEGVVIRPVLTAPDNIPMLEGELSNIERGRPVGQFISQEQLEVVPGGLLSGGRARSVSNIGQDIGFDPETGERIVVPLVDETGERIVQKLAGKRMGEDVGVRGRGGVAGLDTKASIGIYGPELAEYGTAAQTKTGQYTQEASQVPSLVNSEPLQKGKSGGYFTYPQQREANPVKYTQEATPERIASVLLSEQVRKGQVSFPKQNINSYPSSILARPVRINFPEETVKPSPTQLSFPSDVVPATAAAARVRVTPADQAAQQLEAYMGRLQRGRTSPLTSQVRIQPSLF